MIWSICEAYDSCDSVSLEKNRFDIIRLAPRLVYCIIWPPYDPLITVFFRSKKVVTFIEEMRKVPVQADSLVKKSKKWPSKKNLLVKIQEPWNFKFQMSALEKQEKP